MDSLVIKKNLALVQFLILSSIAFIAPFLLNQFLAGPIVNAVLFIVTFILGIQAGILVSLFPSLVAISIGLLPIILLPMIPFIILGNIILVLTFSYFKDKNYWLGVIIASFLKFIFLYSISYILINFILEKEISFKIASMMGWPQLFNALMGGIIAYLFLKIIKRIPC
ncbi:MAG: iron hydrogenase [Candidatus Pacebacteria bacterium]|nr:iron hydrogenase [Candidatus Paceibacterota bacterium]